MATGGGEDVFDNDDVFNGKLVCFWCFVFREMKLSASVQRATDHKNLAR